MSGDATNRAAPESVAAGKIPGPAGSPEPVWYVCKYTPLELFAGFGRTTRAFDTMPADIDLAEHDIPANLCGFGRAVLQAALAGEMRELVLVNCCDTMRRVYDILQDEGCCAFLYLLDLPHAGTGCSVQSLARGLARLAQTYGAYCGTPFNLQRCRAAFEEPIAVGGPYIGIVGVRAGAQLEEEIRRTLPLPVRNLTCTSGRAVTLETSALDLAASGAGAESADTDAFWEAYAAALLAQTPCRRMGRAGERMRLLDDPDLRGIVFHTIQFCDFYSMEYTELQRGKAGGAGAVRGAGASRAGSGDDPGSPLPLLKIETDFTLQSAGQLATRVEAFAETLASAGAGGDACTPPGACAPSKKGTPMELSPGQYVAGLDSGSTSTDVVVMDAAGTIVAQAIIPTGGGAQQSAERSLAQALEHAGIPREAVVRVVATGYGRDFIQGGDASVTEISCHAKGAHFLDPEVRCVIDIGGQDSKVIRVSAQGTVENFVMNDKCAAGTGRFLDMMARALDVDLDELSGLGASWDEEIKISSMCTVFAESEVVSLVAQNKPIDDIVHGLNQSVAAKVGGLVQRAKGEPVYMMTGGVAQNAGVVRALEERLGQPIRVSSYAQLCGAIGAALFALEGR